MTASQDARGVKPAPAFRLWITPPVRDSRHCSRTVPSARTPPIGPDLPPDSPAVSSAASSVGKSHNIIKKQRITQNASPNKAPRTHSTQPGRPFAEPCLRTAHRNRWTTTRARSRRLSGRTKTVYRCILAGYIAYIRRYPSCNQRFRQKYNLTVNDFSVI